ncbi:protein NLP3-like [Phragmites australis]|uniref:protein NLP3-like n=1 Tax=Phragmites australis TaxID=29695 RepID=UPI002D799ABE|nr:protein NLP3-like [Phragmites australis]
MVMEVEADMERVLERFDLILDRDGRRNSCGTGSDLSRSGGGGAAGEEGGGGVVKERIARALRIYKEEEEADVDGERGGVLVQVWAPARDGDRRVLATRGQPFVLAPPQCHRLFQYRTVSLTHAFPVGGAGVPGERGLPGRVFDAGAPEWTPNVQYYGSGEYARISYALIYDIQAALALPILDPDTGSCLAVLELVMTSPRLRFAAVVDKLSKALQAVALRSSEICCPPPEICNDEAADQRAMSGISELLTTVCEAHRLPLAQTWVRCKRCNPDTRRGAALTAEGAPFHLADEGVRGFRDACAEHHLRSGRGGLVEEADAARKPRFCADVTRYSMDAYPLAHHARFCGLVSCLAVSVQLWRDDDASMDGGHGREECVLEFFLPPDCRDGAAQKGMVEAVVATIMERFGNGDLKAIAISGLQDLNFEIVADGECVVRPDRVIVADTHELELNEHGGDKKDSDEEDVHLAAAVGSADIEAPKMNNGEQKEGENPRSRVGKKKKKKGKRKGEKTVSLEELQRYFSGSLKDAATSLGVSPTTMKRICRQHGISRWPFRKIAKANRSLDKIKHVFESVQYSSKPMAAAASQQAAAVAVARRPPALPCLSSALGVASSQGSCQEPPPLKNTALRTPLRGGDAWVVTVKASYRGDIIRFRVPCSAGVAAVKMEVAKRLGLEASSFYVKYLDDDNEWVLLSCDADFQECLDVVPALSAASSSGSGAAQPVVRLMVQEVADIHGSSCGSSD